MPAEQERLRAQGQLAADHERLAALRQVVPQAPAPEVQRRPVRRLRGQVVCLARVVVQVEELLLPVERVEDVLEVPVGQGVPVVLPAVQVTEAGWSGGWAGRRAAEGRVAG
jgi:hypothetical protein